MKKKDNDSKEFAKMAVDTAVFSAGMSVMGEAKQGLSGSSKAVIGGAETLYAAKLLKRTGRGLI